MIYTHMPLVCILVYDIVLCFTKIMMKRIFKLARERLTLIRKGYNIKSHIRYVMQQIFVEQWRKEESVEKYSLNNFTKTLHLRWVFSKS